jgi:hypothetical protein
MSIDTVRDDNPTDADAQFEELPDALATAIDRRIETKVQERTEPLEQKINELETTVEELQEELTDDPDQAEIATDGGPQTVELEVRNDDPDNYNLGDIWLDDIPLGNILDANLSRSKENKKKVEDTKDNTESHEQAIKHLNSVVQAGSSDAEGRSNDRKTAPQIRETPLERVLIDPNSSGVRLTESVTRAMSIAGHFRRWSKSVKAGQVITEDIRKMVNTALDATLSWKQVHRACHKLEDLSNGEIEFKLTDKHGRILVMEDKSWLSNLSRVVSEKNGG